MSESLEALGVQLLLSLVVSVVTAFVTVRLSTKQFYSQRWWEKKAETYSQIMKELSCLEYFFGEWIEKESENRKMSDKKKQKLSEDYNLTKETLERLRSIGAFVISNDAAKSLDELLTQLYKANAEESFIDLLSTSYDAVKECMNKIRDYAKNDLRIVDK